MEGKFERCRYCEEYNFPCNECSKRYKEFKEAEKRKMDKVFKKIHPDKSETVIKQVHSAYRDSDGTYQERDEVVTSIFISSSAGCPKKCEFCHLTEMNMPFGKLSAGDISKNVMDTIAECDFVNFDTTFKLCWMGMGDPMINPKLTVTVTQLLSNVLAFEEVDISTVQPDMRGVKLLHSGLMNRLKLDVRLFYSLHSAQERTRELIVPKTGSIGLALVAMDYFQGDKFIHYTPIQGLNDSLIEGLAMADAARELGCPVRMLEFNPYKDSLYERPSLKQLAKLYKLFENKGVDVKWQVSKGREELAACGMFGECN